MASTDLKSFIEDRLRVLDPNIDLETGSPAQTQFVDPLVQRLGTDPFDTDISKFIADRIAQEFPDLPGDASVISDVFVKPLIMLLEPLKREIQAVRRGQSLKDPNLLSDDDADSLIANVFDERSTGGYARGIVRVKFTNPTNVQVEITNRAFTASGLNYFPTNPRAVTAEEMVFNRQGALYFVDIPMQAEFVGTEYNIGEEEIVGIDGLFGPVSATNPAAFEDGRVRIDTPTFIATARESLNERSAVTRRGANARIKSTFQGDVAAVQVIGADDPEMQRDILVATSPGHAWMTGQVSIYESIALVKVRTVDDDTDTPVLSVGDTLYIYLDKYSYSGTWFFLDQSKRFVRFTVENVLVGPSELTTDGYQLGYVVQWSGDLPEGVTLPSPVVLEGGFSKKGTIRVSSLPSVGEVDLSVNNQEVHIYGHTDIYVRPTLQTASKAVVDNLTNDADVASNTIQRSTLNTFGEDVSNKNKVTDSGFDFVQEGVTAGDILIVESGDDAGSYIINEVGSELYLSQNLTKTATDLRYQIIKSVTFNLFEPRILKIPFGVIPNNDLQTAIGSKVFTVLTASTNLIDLGVREDDVVRITSGSDMGDFVITGFDSNGKEFYVDRAASSSNTNLTYEIFTPLTGVERPLVRIKDMLVLDSAKQSSGISIPPAEPVGVIPTSIMTSALVRGRSQTKSGYVLPALTKSDGSDDYVTGASVAATAEDRRYSLGIDPFTGTYRGVIFPDGQQAELLFPTDADLECSYFLATSEDNTYSENFPPIDPKIGDALTIKSGPNAGSYLIKSVYKFKHISGSKTYWSYFIKIYGTFPVDVLRSVIDFLDAQGVDITDTLISGSTASPIQYPNRFVDAYNALGTKLHTALEAASAGMSPGASTLLDMVKSVAEVDYEWGDPSRGTLRSYFQKPTLFSQNTALSTNPTLYTYTNTTGDTVKFRPDPNRYLKQEIVPARLDEDADPLEYDRDYSQTGAAITFTDTTKPNLLSAGVAIGDYLSVHAETYFHGSTGAFGEDRQTAVKTVAGSARIEAPATASGSVFSADMVGNLFFFDEGEDEGAYYVTKFTDANVIELDRPLTETTPTIILEGSAAQWGYDGTKNKVVAGSAVFVTAHKGKYLTLYGINSEYQGSYKIANDSPIDPTGTTVYLDRPSLSPANFPAYPVNAIGRWVITDGLAAGDPTAVGGATELIGLRPVRMYNDIPTDAVLTDISTEPSVRTAVGGSRSSGTSEPYRIYRNNVRRINPTEMSNNKDGPLYYFDTDVVSLSPSSASNLQKGSYLTVDEGTYDSHGYRHIVTDNTLSYSTLEEGSVVVPNRILPTLTADSPDNFVNLVGVPIQIVYDRAGLVSDLQAFLESTEDRVTSANMLARHFLPAYVSFFASYEGGSSPSVIAKDVISHIESLTVETPLDVSEVQKIIQQRGGNPETPVKISILLHDWDRKQWVEIDENKLGGIETKVPYNGTPRVSFLISGPDISGQENPADGEAISLVRG